MFLLKPFLYLLALIRLLLLIIPMALFLAIYGILSSIFFKNTIERAFWLRRFYVKYACFILGIRNKVEGKATAKPAIYISNHRSLSDPLITSKYIDAFIIAKAEVENIPLISTGAKVTGILFVKRESKQSRSAVREKMKETLLSRQNILVYPEGTVNHLATPLPYRPGTFATSCQLDIPVVPVILEYKKQKDLWYNRGMIAHYFHQFGWPLTHSKLHIGPPMIDSDPIILKEKVEKYTKDKIAEMHKDWNSVFTTKV